MKIKIAVESELNEGDARSFRIIREGGYVGCFLIRFQGVLRAYENRSRHLPISLDYDDARFFDKTGSHLICQTHGALYEPETGACVEGPCQGASLFPIALECRDGSVYVESEGRPESLESH